MSGPIEIELQPREMIQAAFVGVMRQVENVKERRKYPAGKKPRSHPWQDHIEGAMGEMAFAKAIGAFWDGAHKLRGDDVAGGWEVRTRSKHSYDLPIHPEDPDTKRMVLVTGTNGAYRIHGFILAVDGKLKQWWGDPAKDRPAYFVPKSALSPPEELLDVS